MHFFNLAIESDEALFERIDALYRARALEEAPSRGELARYWREGELSPQRAVWFASQAHSSAEPAPAG